MSRTRAWPRQLLALAVVLVVALVLAGCDTGSGSDSGSRSDAGSREADGSPDQAERPRDPVIAGYVDSWNLARGLTSLERNAGRDKLNEISPVLYELTGDGEAVTIASADTLVARARAQGIRVIPVVRNYRDGRWDGDLVGEIVQNPTRRHAHVRALTELVQAHGWAGIDLDYEELNPRDRDAYARFIDELADSLHSQGKLLTVDVAAKTSESGDSEASAATDYEALGQAADEVRIMAYDHSWNTSDPGPVAPIWWVDEVLEYATSHVDPGKLMLGVPAYGYDWSQSGGSSVSTADARALARKHGAVIQWDEDSKSSWFHYAVDGEDHVVWFDDARSLRFKVELAREYGVRGLSIWQLGGEDPAIWSDLS